MDELKPCPFCGGEAELLRDGNGTWGGYKIYCNGEYCTAMMSSFTFREGDKEAEEVDRKTIIEAWNRRAGDADDSR